MRGMVGRACTAGLVIGVLVTGLTACTGDAGGDGKAEACTNGTYAWSRVQRTEKLTEMSDPISFEKRTASYSARLKPVDDKVYRPSVTGAPRGIGAAAVITALGRHLAVEEPLAGPSEKEPTELGHYFEAATGDLKGDYYSWGYIKMVTADFAYTCGNGEPVKGQVLTWEGTGSGFMPCSEELPEGVGARAAARALCPAASRAARAAD
ncbi:hypothetical protein [Streptomyces collinus]|uniref:Lipoprotein n=1 Tax=Streptomyces collinus TaxID=42684 RepID=A0AA89TI82_STRCU|nr:hypothetical protein [Streptomyces collinus]MBB5813611.1 hypothetical protein [Streptomyces collinus]WMX66688.1 hypothetical protein RFN52_26335 [Streptomyces collinus]